MTVIVHYVSLENIQNIYEIVVFCCPDVARGGFFLFFAEDGDHLWVRPTQQLHLIKTSTRREQLHGELLTPVYFLGGRFEVHQLQLYSSRTSSFLHLKAQMQKVNRP